MENKEYGFYYIVTKKDDCKGKVSTGYSTRNIFNEEVARYGDKVIMAEFLDNAAEEKIIVSNQQTKKPALTEAERLFRTIAVCPRIEL